MTNYKQFLLIGGGGGNEIANKVVVYDLKDKGNQLSANMLGKPVHEESTGQDVPSYIDTAMVSITNYSWYI